MTPLGAPNPRWGQPEPPRAADRALRVDWDGVPLARMLDDVTVPDQLAAAPRPRSRRVALVALGIGAAGAAALTGVLLLTHEAPKPGRRAAAPTPARSAAASRAPVAKLPAAAAAPASRPAPTRAAIAKPHPRKQGTHAARHPFVSAGVRFWVVPSPNQQWAHLVRSTDPGVGRRWETVSVLYRNLSRPRLLAEQLRFRLRAANGSLYKPAAGVGNGGSNLAPGAQIPTGKVVQGRLAFQLPADARNLTLLIDPTPRSRVRVALAAG